MPSALEQAGARSVKQNRYAPIHTNRFFSGLWTNRSALRDAATPYLYEKFYSGSRFDALIGGSNMELSSKLTLMRRAGNSVYNSQSFPPINRFFSFKISNTKTSAVKVMADTANTLYDATGPNTKNPVFAKSAGAGRTYMESVGNIMFFGDGIDEMKWVQSLLAWQALTSFTAGNFLVDANDNLQLVSGITAAITRVAISGNILTITVNQNFPVGARVTFNTVATATFLNGVQIQVATQTPTQITANFIHNDYPSAADTGNAVSTSGTGTSAGVQPAFSAVLNGTVTDGNLIWTCKGSAVQNWQAAGPAAAPTVANANLGASFPQWTANTWFSPNLLIVDNQATPNIQKLTTGGTLGGAQPAWNAGGAGSVTNDNTAQWTNQGVAAWQANHNYAAGAFVAVTYTVTIIVTTPGNGSGGSGGGGGRLEGDPTDGGSTQVITTTYNDFFKAIQGGVSGGTAPRWATGVGTQITDNGVIWQNQGAEVLWGTIGAGALVSVNTTISDSNGNKETVITAGKSGAVVPTWSTTQGAPTTDGTITWTNGGPSGGAANSKPWIYVFAGINDITGDITSASPESLQITQAANSFIQVQGQAFTDPQIGTIRLYRTAQGGDTLIKLVDFPNPGSGVWTYNDTNVDGNLNPFFTAAEDGDNDPPPDGLINVVYWKGRMWGSVGNVTHYSAGASATEGGIFKSVTAWPADNTFTWNSPVIRQVKTAIGLLVFTQSDINIVTFDSSTKLFDDDTYLAGMGINGYDALGVHGSLIYLMDTRTRSISLDPSNGVSHVGFPIADQFKAQFNSANTYVTYHVEDGTDEAVYFADGATGWYRLNPTPAPESGMTWSPKATIVGGVKAVQTLEVSPGVHRMLLGPTANGPILRRDLTTNQDNGQNYADCFATIGSIVLAQSGTVAQVEFISDELPRIGSRPTISVRTDEIGGPFYKLPLRVKDPPYLPDSTTLFSDRWYLAATKKPAYCKHMQIQFSFPQENVANEILTYAIFGTILKEK